MTASTYIYGYGNGPWGGHPTRRTKDYILNQSQFAVVHPELMRRLFALADEVISRGSDLGFGGGGRTSQQQYDLFTSRYDRRETWASGWFWWDGRPTWNNWGYWRRKPGVAAAASPGNSYHEVTTQDGYALAVDMIGDHNLANTIEHLFGLHDFANVNNEPWHYQPLEIPNSRRNYGGEADPLPTIILPGEVVSPPPPVTPSKGPVEMYQIRYRKAGWPGEFTAKVTVDAIHHTQNGNASIVDRDVGGVPDETVTYEQLVHLLQDRGRRHVSIDANLKNTGQPFAGQYADAQLAQLWSQYQW